MSHILIIEDEPRFAQPVRKALERAGFSVKVAPSVERARKHLTTAPSVDAIILDIMFRPSGTGMQTLDQQGYLYLVELKQDPTTRHIPVIMYTVKMDDGMERHCREAGAADYVLKMAGGAELLAVVQRVGAPLPQTAGMKSVEYRLPRYSPGTFHRAVFGYGS